MSRRGEDRRHARQAKQTIRYPAAPNGKRQTGRLRSGVGVELGVSYLSDDAERRRHPRLQAGA
jgi:hypothetical protein